MKRTLALLLAALFALLAGCGSEYHPVKPVGEVPEEFVPLIESGLLKKYGAKATANGFLDSDGKDEDGDYNTDYMEFVRYDAYGREQARRRYPQDEYHGHWVVLIFRVNFAGEVTKTVTFSGSGHAVLYCAAPRSDGLDLYLRSDANDGDFAIEDGEDDPAITYWIFRLNDDLQCVSKERVLYDARNRNEYSYYFDSYYFYHLVGYLDGKAVYSDDPRFADADDQRIPVYDGGEVLSVMDYGTFYLVVSYNLTGEIEGIPPESSRWRWTTETVYTAFDKDGDILWRTAVDNAE